MCFCWAIINPGRSSYKLRSRLLLSCNLFCPPSLQLTANTNRAVKYQQRTSMSTVFHLLKLATYGVGSSHINESFPDRPDVYPCNFVQSKSADASSYCACAYVPKMKAQTATTDPWTGKLQSSCIVISQHNTLLIIIIILYFYQHKIDRFIIINYYGALAVWCDKN